MMHFQSEVNSVISKLDRPLRNTNHGVDHEQSESLISPYQSVSWVNDPSAVLLDDKTMEVCEMDTLVHHIGDIGDWDQCLDQSHDAGCIKPLKNAAISSHHDTQFDILSALAKKCLSQSEDSVNNTSFLPVAMRSVNPALIPSFNVDPSIKQPDPHVQPCHGSMQYSDPQESIENDCKAQVLKLPAKRSGRAFQGRPFKRMAPQQLGIVREISQRETHIQSERQRRKGMNHLFERMRSLLPNASQKADKSTIVSEIINYIQSLHLQLEDLNKKRVKILSGSATLSIPQVKSEPSSGESIQSECTGSDSPVTTLSSNDEYTRKTSQLTLHFNGNDVFITMSCVNKANLLPAIIFAVEENNLQVINANVSATDTVTFHSLHVKALETLDVMAREAFKCALQKFLSVDHQICFIVQ